MMKSMKSLIVGFAGLLIVTLAPRPAAAWSHSGYHGSASGGGGSWSASGRYGGSASGGGGSWSGTGRYGGTASGGDGSWAPRRDRRLRIRRRRCLELP
jgi:hypothetical protein